MIRLLAAAAKIKSAVVRGDDPKAVWPRSDLIVLENSGGPVASGPYKTHCGHEPAVNDSHSKNMNLPAWKKPTAFQKGIGVIAKLSTNRVKYKKGNN